MLSYELCKKLKEVGFPQNTKNIFHYASVNQQKKVCCDCGAAWLSREKHQDYLAIPTLSEFIDETKNYLESIRFCNGYFGENIEKDVIFIAIGKEINSCFLGKSAEEAVANFYLALNAKED